MRMFDEDMGPDVKLVGDLHKIGRQLNQLKRVYSSYELIVERLIQRQNTLNGAATSRQRDSNTANEDLQGSQTMLNSTLTLDRESTLGVPMTAEAFTRFERLRDRIRLYALIELEDCLKEKETLVSLVGYSVGLRSNFMRRLTSSPELQSYRSP